MNWLIDEQIRRVNSKLFLVELDAFRRSTLGNSSTGPPTGTKSLKYEADREVLRLTALQIITGMISFSTIFEFEKEIIEQQENDTDQKKEDPLIKLLKNLLYETEFKKIIIPVNSHERVALDNLIASYISCSSTNLLKPKKNSQLNWINLLSDVIKTTKSLWSNQLLCSLTYHLYSNNRFVPSESVTNSIIQSLSLIAKTYENEKTAPFLNDLDKDYHLGWIQQLKTEIDDVSSNLKLIFNYRNKLTFPLFVNSVSQDAPKRLKAAHVLQALKYGGLKINPQKPQQRPPLIR